jgi:hypothetical protein
MTWTTEVGMCVIPLIMGLVWPFLHHRYRAKQNANPRVELWLHICLIPIVVTLQLAQHALETLGSQQYLGLPMNLGSGVLFPLTLVIILYLCVTRNPFEFRLVFIAIFLCTICITIASYLLRKLNVLGINVDEGFRQLWDVNATYRILYGGLLTLLDGLAMVLVYRTAVRQCSSLFFRILLPLVAGILLDATLYSIVDYLCPKGLSSRPYVNEFLSQLNSKAITGFIYTTLVFLYLRTDTKIASLCVEMSTRDFLKRVVPSTALTFCLSFAGTGGSTVGRDRTGSMASLLTIVNEPFMHHPQYKVTESLSFDSVPKIADKAGNAMEGKLLSEYETPHEVISLIEDLRPLEGFEPGYEQELLARLKMSKLFGGSDVAVCEEGSDLRILRAGPCSAISDWFFELSQDDTAKVGYIARPAIWRLAVLEERYPRFASMSV